MSQEMFGLIVLVTVSLIVVKVAQGLAAATGRKSALRNAEDIYASVFDGSRTAVYESSRSTLPVELITDAADERGYDVISVVPGGKGENAKTITFRLRE